MELYSKRNTSRGTRLLWREKEENRNVFLSEVLRKRLQQEVEYDIKSNSFFEPHLIVHNEVTQKFYLHETTLSEISLRELGYDITTVIIPSTLFFEDDPKVIDDYKFFDLIELLLVFSRKSERQKLAARLSSILQEEGDLFTVHGFMIFKKGEAGLSSLRPLIKEQVLAKKVKEYYDISRGTENLEFRARISADIVQNIFSASSGQKDTKKHSEDLCNKVAERWTAKKNVKELSALLSETVQNAKKLSNQIANIRHTDRHAIPVNSPNLYALIAAKNIRIAELFILSLPEQFIASKDPEDMKQDYFRRYGVSPTSSWVVQKPEEATIKDSDLPF